jgi:hypothetical protein
MVGPGAVRVNARFLLVKLSIANIIRLWRARHSGFFVAEFDFVPISCPIGVGERQRIYVAALLCRLIEARTFPNMAELVRILRSRRSHGSVREHHEKVGFAEGRLSLACEVSLQ